MNEYELWVTMWRTFMFMVFTVTATIGGCDAYQNKLVADLVMHGTDPVAARCAIMGTSGEVGRTILCLKAEEKK